MLSKINVLTKQELAEISAVLGIKPHAVQSLQWVKMFCLEGRVHGSLLEDYKADSLEQMFKDCAKKIHSGEDLRLTSQIEAANREKTKGTKKLGDARFGRL
jgi:hypothetical protein